MRIAIDAMGGDHAPASIVAGALVAARRLQCGLLLVGVRHAIERELAKHPGAASIVAPRSSVPSTSASA